MAQQILNAGTTNNDRTGDTLRAGGLKIKANFAEIYNALSTDGLNISGGNLLKSGGWSDIRNKPTFHAIATRGSFADLEYKPDFALVTSVPNNLVGHGGEMAGNVAFDGTNLYVAIADHDGETEIWKQIPWGGTDLGNFKISGNTLGTTAESNGWGASDMSICPNGEGYAYIYIPNDTNSTGGSAIAIGNTSTTGGGIQLNANNGSWQFKNDGKTIIPHGVNGPSTARGSAGDTAGTILVSGAYLFYCYANYTDGSTPIWQKVAMDNTDWD